jgi:hypothetical protein
VCIGKPPLPLLPDLLTFAFLPPSALMLQVRRIIWKLFALCPTPAAAISADLQQVQASTPAPHFSAHVARQLSAADAAPLLPSARSIAALLPACSTALLCCSEHVRQQHTLLIKALLLPPGSQALIQPLGLFRKRALAIQQLSHDYLYKQASLGGCSTARTAPGVLLLLAALHV